MSIQNILVILRSDEGLLQQLRDAAPGAQVIRQSVKTLTAQQVEAADVVVGNLPPEYLPHMKKAKLLQLNTAGVAPPYLKWMEENPDVTVCCASGAYGPAISEHMMGTLLMLMKRLHQYRDQQKQGAWVDHGEVVSPRNAKVLVMGMGDIGTHFAKLVHGFGAEVIGMRRRPGNPPEGVTRIATMEELDSLLPWADIVAMALPETKETIRIMNADRIGRMKQGSYLLNVGRGSAVDQDALVKALQEGRIAGAALDVTDPEPLPPEHPLWQQEHALITPHISGQYHLRLTLENIYSIAAHNIGVLQGKGAFISRVDAKSGYRA